MTQLPNTLFLVLNSHDKNVRCNWYDIVGLTQRRRNYNASAPDGYFFVLPDRYICAGFRALTLILNVPLFTFYEYNFYNIRAMTNEMPLDYAFIWICQIKELIYFNAGGECVGQGQQQWTRLLAWSRNYNEAEGAFIWDSPGSFPVKFPLKFLMNSSSDFIS